MEGLIEIRLNNNQEQLVSARELYEKLNIKTQYTKWFDRMTEYGFKENIDYTTISQKRLTAQGNETTYNDHIIKLDMAKEIAMIQRTNKGKEIREYFIKVENDWNTPDKVMARALVLANNKLELLQTNYNQLQIENKMQEQVINEMKSKVDYTDEILRSKNVMNINQIAKDYGMSGQKLNSLLARAKVQYKQNGQWLLYSKYQDKGYTHSNTIKIVRRNGQNDIRLQTKWTQKGRLFIYEFMKKNGFLPLIEQEDK